MDNTSGKMKGNFLKYHPGSMENLDFSSFSSNRKYCVSSSFSPAVSQQAQQCHVPAAAECELMSLVSSIMQGFGWVRGVQTGLQRTPCLQRWGRLTACCGTPVPPLHQPGGTSPPAAPPSHLSGARLPCASPVSFRPAQQSHDGTAPITSPCHAFTSCIPIRNCHSQLVHRKANPFFALISYPCEWK